ncbi:MAG: TRAP transporter substrate-binding protein [Deltaproteobacteria bacterium]|nr:TRAP transporter substrate-binding protein [Deltaproteobacteria bacterium]
MKSVKWFLVFSLLLAAALMLVSSAPVHAKKTVELRWCTFFPPSHPLFPMSQDWGKAIEKRTGGQVKFTYFAGGTLLKGNEIYDGILKGVTDIGMSCFAYTRGRFPTMEAVDLPMGYTSGMSASFVINDFYNTFKPEALSDVKVLFLHAHGPGLLHSKKPVRTLADMQGLKIRSTGFSAKVSKALGAVPVAMPMGGTYEALKKGVVEASFGPMEVLKTWKQAEVVKYTTECYSVGYTTGFFVAMNLKKWNALPDDVKKVFEEVSKKYIAKAGAVWDAGDAAGKKFALELGGEMIPQSREESEKWAEAVLPVISGYEKKTMEAGLPADEYVKTLREMVDKYNKKFKKN